MRRMLNACLMVALVSCVAIPTLAQHAPAREPDAPPPTKSAPSTRPGSDGAAATVEVTALDAKVDQILTRLEQREVDDLSAELTWSIEYALEEAEDKQIMRGEIWFRQMKPVGRFLIQLRDKVSGGTRKKIDERHLFDGEWYVVVDGEARQVSRHEVRRPNDRSNPFRLGEGPFPVPFGQRKADMLREFEIVLIAPGEKGEPPETDHLKLTPRAGTESAKMYKWLHFWIARQGAEAGLPVQVKAGKRDGTGQLNSTITVRFENAKINSGLAPSLFAIETPAGFAETVERLEPPAP